ncbi:spermidine/putrescine-binding periplasmic protein (SPBP) [Actinobacillus equuli]|nr:spermidine/putrescine-binding periplasmic protein (SPBP) [Actinobacillus equuli]
MPNVLVFNSDSPEMPYLQGEVSVGMQWSGSAHRAKSENPDLNLCSRKKVP